MNGATATVTVGVGSTTITGFEVFAPGSGYVGGETLTVEGFSGASIGVPTAGITSAIGEVVSITGIGTTTDGLYKISSLPSKNSVAIALTAGDPLIVAGQFAYRVAPSSLASTLDIKLVTTITIALLWLRKGSKFKVVDVIAIRLAVYSNTVAGIKTFTTTTVILIMLLGIHCIRSI